MNDSSSYTMVNPQNGNLAFKLFYFDDNSHFDHIQRYNYFSLIWITKGKGRIRSDFNEYEFEQNSLFAFTPYQPFMFITKEMKGVALFFHSDFYCIHKHQKEIATNGVLFNNIYLPPFININEETAASLNMLLEQIKKEMQFPALAQYDLLVSYLKIFLIKASRIKAQQQPSVMESYNDTKEPFILQQLKDAIEKDFKTKHTASDYASDLNLSPNALAKITKNYFDKTLTQLISERIIIEAKRELYLSDKTVKEIAFELGYQDEYYFSRFFKTNTDVSPQLYRETVGFARGI